MGNQGDQQATGGHSGNPVEVHQLKRACEALLEELETAIVGKRHVLTLIVNALLANGHILLEDVPGVAKTAIARALAQAAGLRFSRVQFTPDLIPADITGSTILTGADGELAFKPGPVFANLVLGDEINRAPPKTQSALLEAMEERQVTTEGVSRKLPDPFLVVGTQNPIEQEGTYPLPEAQLDRFLIRTGIGYPGRDNEVDLVLRRSKRGVEQAPIRQILRTADVLAMQQRVEQVHVSPSLAGYIVDLVDATRTSDRTEAGASPRGSLALLKVSRARAAMEGRDYVLPDDVKHLAIPCLAHRLLLKPDQWVRGVKPEQVIQEILSQVKMPPAVEPADQGGAASAAVQPDPGGRAAPVFPPNERHQPGPAPAPAPLPAPPAGVPQTPPLAGSPPPPPPGPH